MELSFAAATGVGKPNLDISVAVAWGLAVGVDVGGLVSVLFDDWLLVSLVVRRKVSKMSWPLVIPDRFNSGTTVLVSDLLVPLLNLYKVVSFCVSNVASPAQ